MCASVLWAFPVLMQSSRSREVWTEKVCVERVSGKVRVVVFVLFFYTILGMFRQPGPSPLQDVFLWIGLEPDQPVTCPETYSNHGCGKGGAHIT